MIKKQEILSFSKKLNLSSEIIEKDYVLGWLLAGIANDKEVFENWIFKGGTCIKKCYFENYRFSEDLDYTLKNNKHINREFLIEKFKKITNWVYEESGITFPSDKIRFEVYENNMGNLSVEGRISYIGPLQRQGNPARVIFDLTSDEFLALKPVLRKVFHPYSDLPLSKIKSYCYDFSEIFSEKIRALSQRLRPRDLYDVINLFQKKPSGLKSSEILLILKKKCQYKNMSIPDMKQIEAHPKMNELKEEWENMLSHQIAALPPIENFLKKLPILFDWLE